MATVATPPGQINSSPTTPQTPLHGAKYNDDDSPRTRFSTRLRQKRQIEPSRVAKSPKQTPRNTSLQSTLSPGHTPKRNTISRPRYLSPTSPDSDYSSVGRSSSNSRLQLFPPSTITTAEGMLPTPVKTPKKKHISKSNIAARALFQDAMASDGMTSSPRRIRKAKRFNGFSLESFKDQSDSAQGGVQIFTDSRDHVPEVDESETNPFLIQTRTAGTSQQVSGTSKRRKIHATKSLDPQVEEAISKDEGMVYIFRGKKVYRRFDDTGEEEEELDPSDLGLLRYHQDSIQNPRKIKTMTRKSIKPTRLFQTEEQKRAREMEQEEEEAATDIEDGTAIVPKSPVLATNRASPDLKAANPYQTDANPEATKKAPKGKRTSPFDSWRRLKPGSASAPASASTRGRKRAVPAEFETPGEI